MIKFVVSGFQLKAVSVTVLSLSKQNVIAFLDSSTLIQNRKFTTVARERFPRKILYKSSLLFTASKAKMSTSTTSHTIPNNNNNNINNFEDVRKSKQKLRKQIRSQLANLSSEDITSQSQAVWDELYKLPQYQTASSVGLFLSMPKGEILTDHPCQKVLNDGKALYVPRVGLDFEQCDMDMIQVVSNKATTTTTTATDHNDDDDNQENKTIFYQDWPKNKWGIPEAPRDVDFPLAQPGSIDLLVVPGLGFDRNGGRLGQGKGYYDRFITKMSSDEKYEKPLLVAVGLEPSFVEEGIPTNQYDCMMDMVILPHLGTLVVNKNL